MLSIGPLRLGLMMILFIFFLFLCFPTFFRSNVAFFRFWQSSTSFDFCAQQSEKKSMANFITRMQNECLCYKYNSHDFKCHHKLEHHTSSVKNYAPRAVSYAPWEDLYYSHHSWRLSYDDCNIFIVQATGLSFVTYWVKIDRYWPNSATLWECAKNNRA